VQNKYQIKPPLPFVPGSEYAGVVQAVGEGVKHSGGPACGLPFRHGRVRHAYAGTCRHVHAAAGRLPLVDAAAFIMTYATSCADRPRSAQGRRDRARAGRGGRVGTAAIQIAKAAGAGDCGGLHRREMRAVQAHRCRRTINYSQGDLREAIKATDGKGPDVIYDPVGGDSPNLPSAPLPGAAAI
jgi:NADPH2:quinone reductase